MDTGGKNIRKKRGTPKITKKKLKKKKVQQIRLKKKCDKNLILNDFTF